MGPAHRRFRSEPGERDSASPMSGAPIRAVVSRRKRVRESNGSEEEYTGPMDNMDTRNGPIVREASADDEEFIDVIMDQQDAYDDDADEIEAQAYLPPVSLPRRSSAAISYVPFYPHLGAQDFDDDYLG